MEKQSKIELGSLYDLNKQIIAQIPPQNERQLRSNYDTIGAWFGVPQNPNYYTLMCREKNDITLIHIVDANFSHALEILKELLEERGTVHSIQYIHGEDVFEIWVLDKKTKEASMYMLFEANWMVVDA